jgi:radical SAM protein with 4Fe4S-binding SPASM domain
MSLDNLASAVAWAAARGVTHVILGGGEPTVYAHLGRLFEMACAHGMVVHLTSNCLYPRAVRDLIDDPPVCELVAHYDQERQQSAEAEELFVTNLRSARERSILVMFRYTLTEQSGPHEWRPLMDLAQKLSVDRINYALAFCGFHGVNEYFNCREAVSAKGGRLQQTLKAFFADAAAWKLRLHLSKPFPLCAIDMETFRSTLGTEAIRSACAMSRDGFTRNLTINPDLSVFPCNGIALRGPKITEFATFEDAGRHCSKAVGELMLQPYDAACRNCALWYRGFCQGVCFAEQFWKSRHEKAGGGAQ